MKTRLLTIGAGLALAVTLFVGCITAPKYPSLPTPALPSVAAPSPAPSLMEKIFHRDAAPVIVTGPVTIAPATSQAAPAPVKATAMGEIQKVINGFVSLFILAALAGIGFGAFLIYSGHYVSGIQFVAGGLGLAIFGVWFAFHWLLVVSLGLTGAGIFFLCTHYALVKPILDKIEAAGLSFEQTIMKKL